MKKLIVTDPVQICGLDLISGTSDKKRKYMGYDTVLQTQAFLTLVKLQDYSLYICFCYWIFI
jgi:hypothetical protein